MKNKQKIFIQILIIIGLVLAVKLSYIYYHANYDEYALPSFCSINDFIDCDAVAKTTYSQFWGIPLSFWGIFLYLLLFFLTIVDRLKKIKIFKFLEVFKNPKQYIATIGSFSFLCSIILAIISFCVIKKLCILCLITYFINLFISLIATDYSLKELILSYKTTFFDFVEGVKKYPKTFIILLITAITFLSYSAITLNFVPKVKASASIKRFANMKHNPYKVSGNTLGNPNAEVTIELYSDFVCPLCYVHNIMLHKAVREYKNIKIIHHNYPFDKECNRYISINMHPDACFMSKGAIVAEKYGNYWGMSTLLYENKPVKVADMLDLVDKLGFDKTKFLEDFNSKDTEKKLMTEIKTAAQRGIDATPTMIINDKKIVGIKPYYKLKEILEENGARK